MKHRPTLTEHTAVTLSSTPAIDSVPESKKPRWSLTAVAAYVSNRFCTDTVIGNSASSVHQEFNQEKTMREKLEVSLAKTVRYVVIAFSLALLPTIIAIGVGTLSTLKPSSPQFNPVAKATWGGFVYISSRIFFSNSLANCLIYSFRSSNFRATLKEMFCCFH